MFLFCFSLHCNLNSPPLNLQLHWNNCWWQQTSLNHSDTTRALCWSYCSINGLLWESVKAWGCMMQIKMRNRTATGNLFPITTFNKSSCLCTCRTGTICLSWLLGWIHAPTEKHALEQPAAFCLAWVGERHSIGVIKQNWIRCLDGQLLWELWERSKEAAAEGRRDVLPRDR